MKQLLFVLISLIANSIHTQTVDLPAARSVKAIDIETIRTTAVQSDDTLLIRGTKGNPFGVYEVLKLEIQKEPTETKIKAIVQDEQQTPLIEAAVAAYADGNILKATTTNDKGEFSLTVPAETEKIEISYLAHQVFKAAPAYFIDHPIISLKQNANLPEVVLVAKAEKITGGCIWHLLEERTDSIATLNIGFAATSWQVYPNPTLESIRVKTVFTDGQFHLMNASGQILKTFSLEVIQNAISLTAYPAGAYFLKYESSTWSETYGPIIKVSR